MLPVISHIHTAPKSTSELQAQITYLLNGPGARTGLRRE